MQTQIVDSSGQERFRLLIVDDDVMLARSLQQLTELVGYEVSVCHRGKEALAAMQHRQFDLVLLDLVMPEMTGHEVMQHLVRDYPQIPIIIVTATGTLDEAVQSLKKGAYDFVRKPYEPAELLRTIENALEKCRLERLQQATVNKLGHFENLYQYLVDSSPDVIFTLDNKGRFSFINKRVFSLLGYLVDELIGEHYSSLIHYEDVDAAKYAFSTWLSHQNKSHQNKQHHLELRLKCQSARDEYRYFDISFLPFRTSDGTGHLLQASQTQGMYGVARDITERKKVEHAMAYQAHHDMLTGLPNRILFNDRLEISIAHAKRNQHRLAVLFLDLDRFKWVNDTLGHLYGDELLKNVGARLKACLREGDTLARIGGDEFTVILPEVNVQEDVYMVAQKILDTIERTFVLDSRDINISASIGIAIFPDHGDSIDNLTKCADIAMYHVKWKGKNGYKQYDQTMNSAFHHKLSIQNDLRKAIEQNTLDLYLQPKVDVLTQRIVGFEALTRWHHPESGWIPPMEFIPMAEEVGLITMLTDWLIGQVTQLYREMRKANVSNIPIAMNISPETLLKNDFVNMFVQAFHQAGMPGEFLEIEITENIIMQDIESCVSKLNELKKLGVSIAIDDFGTGYSSLAYLQKLPVDVVKIDQTFVQHILDENQDLPVINAIVGIARGFNLDIVAEGVETLVQMQVLQRLGCNCMQGYYFSKPIPASDVISLVQSQQTLFSKVA